MKKLYKQLIRFGFVGGTAFLIDFGVLWLLTEAAQMNYLLANCLSFTASVIYNYIMSIFWVFEVKESRKKTSEILIFFLLSLIGLGINQLIMWCTVEQFFMNYLFSKVLATGIVMVYNFITRKMFLERD